MSARCHARSRAALLAVLLGCSAVPSAACRLDAGPSADAGDAFGSDARDAALDGSGARAHCVVVTTTEFRSDGAIAIVDADSLVVVPDQTAVHSDAVVHVEDGRVFVINRQGGDSIQELDPAAGFRSISQRSVGPGTNPWGIALLADGTAWVTLYNRGALQRVDLEAGTEADFRVGEPVALPTWTDDDGRVEPRDAFVHAGVLYVLVQGLDDYPRCTPGSRGWLHAFDPDTLAPVEAFSGASSLELAACNPRDVAFVGLDTIAIAHAGGHRVNGVAADDGGIELVDLAAGRSLGLVATESDLGDRDVVAIASDGWRLWLSLADADFTSTVHPADLDEGMLSTPTVAPPGGIALVLGPEVWRSDEGGIFDVAAAWGRVWVADRSLRAPGLVVIDPLTEEVVAGPLDTGFPPFDIDFVEVPGEACVSGP